jgi:hypothetical protein
MAEPHVPHIIRILPENIQFTVMAYRQLTDDEVRQRIALYYRITPAKDHPKSGDELILTCVDGAA